MAGSNRDILQADKGTRWDDHNGRKPKKEIVLEWRKDHPEGKKADCVRDTKLDKKTVYKMICTPFTGQTQWRGFLDEVQL